MATRKRASAGDTQPAGVAVVVEGSYQVNHDGRVYGPGERVTVPADVAERWQRCGYVRPA